MNQFEQAFEQFKTAGNLLKLTQDFEHGIPQAQHFDVNDTRIDLIDSGVVQITPNNLAKHSTDLIISSGIHGNETAPIEIVNQLVSEIISGAITATQRVLFIIGNPVAMNMSQRFEIENLNRLFCQKHKQTADSYEKTRAQQLEQLVDNFYQSGNGERLHYDLHTAIRASKYEKFAIYPYKADKNWCKQQLAFLQSSGVNTILFGHAPSGTFSYFTSSQYQAHAFTVELGKVKPFGENNMENFAAMTNNLRQLIVGKSVNADDFADKNFNLFEVIGDITKETDQFELFIADDVSNFTDFPVGTQLSQDVNQGYVTSQPGESIVFPNAKVANGQRAGLMVVPTALEDSSTN